MLINGAAIRTHAYRKAYNRTSRTHYGRIAAYTRLYAVWWFCSSTINDQLLAKRHSVQIAASHVCVWELRHRLVSLIHNHHYCWICEFWVFWMRQGGTRCCGYHMPCRLVYSDQFCLKFLNACECECFTEMMWSIRRRSPVGTIGQAWGLEWDSDGATQPINLFIYEWTICKFYVRRCKFKFECSSKRLRRMRRSLICVRIFQEPIWIILDFDFFSIFLVLIRVILIFGRDRTIFLPCDFSSKVWLCLFFAFIP